jgi:hypothetical protein
MSGAVSSSNVSRTPLSNFASDEVVSVGLEYLPVARTKSSYS